MADAPTREERRSSPSVMNVADDRENEKKPVVNAPSAAAAADSTLVTIKIWGQDNSELFFRIKRNAKLQRLMDAYCAYKHVNVKAFKFIFEGQFVKGWQTANDVGLNDGDELSAMLEQMAG